MDASHYDFLLIVFHCFYSCIYHNTNNVEVKLIKCQQQIFFFLAISDFSVSVCVCVCVTGSCDGQEDI